MIDISLSSYIEYLNFCHAYNLKSENFISFGVG